MNEKGKFSYLGRIAQFLFRAMYHVTARHLRRKYDLIHVHSVPDFLVFAAWLPRISGTPVVLDIHDILPEFYNSKFGTRPDSLAFRFLQSGKGLRALLASCDHRESYMAGAAVIAIHRARQVHRGYSPDRSIFTKGDGTPAGDGRFSLLYPGSINWHQGPDVAIGAFGK